MFHARLPPAWWLQGRIDDNIETIRKRFRVFVDQSIPVVAHYAKQGKVLKVRAYKGCIILYDVMVRECKGHILLHDVKVRA